MKCSTLLEKVSNENACCGRRSGKTSRMTCLFVSATEVSILRVGRTDSGGDDGDSAFPDIFSMSVIMIESRAEWSNNTAVIPEQAMMP